MVIYLKVFKGFIKFFSILEMLFDIGLTDRFIKGGVLPSNNNMTLDTPTKVMINGLPGNMATLVAERLLKEGGYELIPYSLTGPEQESGKVVDLSANGVGRFELLKPDEREARISGIKERYGPFISIDYTHPTAVNPNADFYCRHKLPFVMGTSGGDRGALEQRVRDSDIHAVVAPNMGAPLVVFQSMIQTAARAYGGSLRDYSLRIVESHQKGKADPSGFATELLPFFEELGLQMPEQPMESVRDPERQVEMGVPREALGGHAFHTYQITSPSGDVLLSFTHNVIGREPYVDGTIQAIEYLKGKIAAGEQRSLTSRALGYINTKLLGGERGNFHTMVDVLRGR